MRWSSPLLVFCETLCFAIGQESTPTARRLSSFKRQPVSSLFVSRAYTLKRRAERQDETRQRIVDAAIELHQTIGPNATTISEIAERAGVGRVTIYRHFPDELTLARACSGQYLERNPPPDPERWRAIADAEERLRTALRETSAYHRAPRKMFSHVLADARDHPVLVPYHQHWRRAIDVLLE